MEKLNVIMLGPTLSQHGGMATVENLIMQRLCTDVEVRHIASHDEGSILHRLHIFAWALTQLVWQLLKGRVDIVHIHVSERGSVPRKGVLALIAFAFRKPVIMHTHGCEFRPFYDQLPQLGKSVVSWLFQHCAYVITLSESWQKYYLASCDLSPKRTLTLSNPVEIPAKIPSREGADLIRFVFLGRIGKRKGTFDLIQAFANLAPELKSRCELTLAGDGEIEEAIELIQALNLKRYIKLPGWLTSAECNQLLQQSHVFMLPSYNEGLPMAMLEAMAWGLPVISTPVGGVPEVAIHQRNGFLVNPGDIEQIVESMEALIADEPMRLAMGKCARQQVMPLNAHVYCQNLFSLYCSVVEGKKCPDNL